MNAIRHARATDVHEIERLVRTDPEARFDAGELYGHGHLIVLDDGNGKLGGVAHLDVVGDRARLDLLVVDEQADEDRLRDVARALGAAYGCPHVETVPIDHASLPRDPLLERGMHDLWSCVSLSLS
jgi:hypothetical protein